MPNENRFTIELDPELHDQFLAEAEAAQRQPSHLVRDLVAEFVSRQRELREHEAWFRGEIERGLREADDPTVQRVANEQVAADWRAQRAELQKRVGMNAT